MEREEWNRDDALRPLTREGEKQMGKVARALQEMGLEFDLIVSSPYERAKRTAEIVAAKLKLRKQLKFSAELSPEGNQRNWWPESRLSGRHHKMRCWWGTSRT